MEDAQAIVDLLNANWNPANTSNRKPKIDLIYNHKTVDVKLRDWVLIYSATKTRSFFSIGGKDFEKTARVTIDIRSSSKTRYLKIKEEVRRILMSNVQFGNYLIVAITSENELSDKTYQLYRCTMDVELKEIETI